MNYLIYKYFNLVEKNKKNDPTHYSLFKINFINYRLI